MSNLLIPILTIQILLQKTIKSTDAGFSLRKPAKPGSQGTRGVHQWPNVFLCKKKKKLKIWRSIIFISLFNHWRKGDLSVLMLLINKRNILLLVDWLVHQFVKTFLTNDVSISQSRHSCMPQLSAKTLLLSYVKTFGVAFCYQDNTKVLIIY